MLTSRNAGQRGSFRGRAAGPLVALALVVAGALPAAAQPRPGGVRPEVRPPQQVRPLDPLTARERDIAVRLATADERVQRLIDGRTFDVAYTELVVLKREDALTDTPERPGTGGRTAEVLISVFGRPPFTGIQAIVDVQAQPVASVESYSTEALAAEGREQTPPFRVPFSAAEQRFAREVALASAEVRSLLGAGAQRFEVEGLPITRPIPDVCPSGRCLEMIFRRGDTYLTTTVIVDIPTQTSRLMRGPQ